MIPQHIRQSGFFGGYVPNHNTPSSESVPERGERSIPLFWWIMPYSLSRAEGCTVCFHGEVKRNQKKRGGEEISNLQPHNIKKITRKLRIKIYMDGALINPTQRWGPPAFLHPRVLFLPWQTHSPLDCPSTCVASFPTKKNWSID